MADRNGRVRWSEDIASDGERAAMLDRGTQSADVYAEEMSRLLPKKTSFGLSAIAGFLNMPFKVSALGQSAKGSINALMFAFRIYEAFGLDKAVLIGLEARGFIDTNFQQNLPPGTLEQGVSFPASGGMFTAVVAYSPRFSSDLRAPRLRLGAEVGAFLGGSLGNNVVAGGVIEMTLVQRFGVNLALLYTGESKSAIGPATLTVGGFTWAAGGSFNWD
jgi:hypothetical protein